jgi:hypothetical protein
MQIQHQGSASDSHLEVFRGVDKEPGNADLDRHSTVEDRSEPESSLEFATRDSWYVPNGPNFLYKQMV